LIFPPFGDHPAVDRDRWLFLYNAISAVANIIQIKSWWWALYEPEGDPELRRAIVRNKKGFRHTHVGKRKQSN
jgi:hypothetical protein